MIALSLQRLRPNEQVDMPVFFFIDPDILDDPSMDGVNNITLSYTFFKVSVCSLCPQQQLTVCVSQTGEEDAPEVEAKKFIEDNDPTTTVSA